MRQLPRIALTLVLCASALAAAAAVLSPVARADTPYLSALSAGSIVAGAAPSPLCNLKQCTGKNRCRASHVLSHCDLSSGTCVTESCTR